MSIAQDLLKAELGRAKDALAEVEEEAEVAIHAGAAAQREVNAAKYRVSELEQALQTLDQANRAVGAVEEKKQ